MKATTFAAVTANYGGTGRFRIEERKLLAGTAYRATWSADFNDRDRAMSFFASLAHEMADFDPHGDHQLVLLGPDRSRR